MLVILLSYISEMAYTVRTDAFKGELSQHLFVGWLALWGFHLQAHFSLRGELLAPRGTLATQREDYGRPVAFTMRGEQGPKKRAF